MAANFWFLLASCKKANTQNTRPVKLCYNLKTLLSPGVRMDRNCGEKCWWFRGFNRYRSTRRPWTLLAKSSKPSISSCHQGGLLRSRRHSKVCWNSLLVKPFWPVLCHQCSQICRAWQHGRAPPAPGVHSSHGNYMDLLFHSPYISS